jgi:hypothetical protein
MKKQSTLPRSTRRFQSDSSPLYNSPAAQRRFEPHLNVPSLHSGTCDQTPYIHFYLEETDSVDFRPTHSPLLAATCQTIPALDDHPTASLDGWPAGCWLLASPTRECPLQARSFLVWPPNPPSGIVQACRWHNQPLD